MNLITTSLATHRELSLFWKLALTMAVNAGYQKRKRVASETLDDKAKAGALKTTPLERKSRSRSSNRKYPGNPLYKDICATNSRRSQDYSYQKANKYQQ
jgi:hypothetical protein